MSVIDFDMGANAKVYYGTADAALSGMTELSNIKDVTLTAEDDEVDVSRRASGLNKSTANGMRNWTVEFDMPKGPDQTSWEAIRDAWLDRTPLELAVLTGARSVSDSEGPKGTWAVLQFSRDEALAKEVTAHVVAKMHDFDEYVEDGVEVVS